MRNLRNLRNLITKSLGNRDPVNNQYLSISQTRLSPSDIALSMSCSARFMAT